MPKHHQTAVKLAAAIYEPTPEAVRATVKKYGFPVTELEIIEGPAPLGERAMVTIVRGVAYIIYRGTVNVPQWLSNAQAKFRPLSALGTNGLAVHSGFYKGLQTVQPQVLEKLQDFIRMGYPVVIAGHSRGAGFAYTASQLMDQVGAYIAEIHCFGAPRAFNPIAARTFNRLFNGKAFRWVANNDAVTRVPFRWMGYRHAGREYYFNALDELHINPPNWVKIRGQFRGRLRGGWLDGLSDHNAVQEYVRLVGNLDI